MKSPRSNNQTVRGFLAFLSAYAFFATWGISLLNGTLGLILDIRSADIPLIPNTTEPLRLHFTGVGPIDYWYTIMVLFFWEAVDGSHPATSFLGIYFLGQLLPVLTLIFVEGYRFGNNGLIIARSILWALLIQNLTLACFGPIYFAIHLKTSPTVNYSTITNEKSSRVLAVVRSLQYLPFSLILGFLLPTILISLPSPKLASYASQQAAIAVWTPFPVWVGLSQAFLTWCDAKVSSRSRPLSPTEKRATFQNALRRVYTFTLVGSTIVHLGTMVTSWSTFLFPAIFAAGVGAEFAPTNLLFPQNSQVDSIGAGVLKFMQWDQWIGYIALLTWVVSLERDVAIKSWARWIWKAVKIILVIILFGPGGAAVLLVWRRDERRLSAEQQVEIATKEG